MATVTVSARSAKDLSSAANPAFVGMREAMTVRAGSHPENADDLVVSVPNRKVTETTVQNLTKAGHTYDSLSATVTTDKDVNVPQGCTAGTMGGVVCCALAVPCTGVGDVQFGQLPLGAGA